MKQKICQIMMLLFVCMTGKAYDFAYDSGHGNLVYNIIDNATTTDVVEVEVTHIANVVERSYIDIIKGDENVNYVTGNITIPSQFMKNGNLYRVVRISDDAFLNCYNLTSVTIPNSVTSIGDYAFFNCTGLTAMEIPDGVTAIGEFAFCKCSNLTSVTIPNSVTSIGGEAFSRTGLINVTIPGSVNFIVWGPFMQCYSLKRAVIEDGVTYIQGNTFAWCGNLEEVVFPSTLSQSIINNVKRGKMYNVLGGTSRLTHVVMPIGYPISRHAEIFNGEDLNHSVLFTIPEGSAKNYLQTGYYNISDKSELAWMAEEFESEATRVAALTTAESIIASEEAKTALQTAITTARSAVEEADSYLAIGAQIDAVKTAAKTFLGTATIAAETDVTAILRNPQFDRMDMGWDVNVGTTWQGCSIGYMRTDGYNDYTNGGVNIHDFLEAWWNGAALGDGRLAQTIPNLPAGRYRLECDAIASWQDDANVEVTGVNLFAGTEMTPVATENGMPEHFTVSFENSETQDVTIGIQLTNTTANWVAMDNVRLYVDENIIEFADAEVKRICVKNWDTNKDGELSTAEAATVTSLGNVFMQNTDITSFDELQFFTGLTAIGESAFAASGLTSVTIPNSVTSIGAGAFAASGLTSVTIPNSVTSIGDFAFEYCYGLTSVTIGSGVTSIGVGAFLDCSGLESINVHPSNPKYEDCSGSNIIVEKSTRTLILGCKGTEEIPNSVTSIGYGAFYGCSGLTSVTIPNSVTSIGDFAFYDCSGLTSVTIPNSVTSIGYGAFAGCSGLESINVHPSNPKYEDCSGSNIIVEKSTRTLIVGCKGTEEIPNSVTSIGEFAFWGCSGLTSVTIPNSVTSIGVMAFESSGLTSVTIPNSVTSIGEDAFYYCYGLTSVTSNIKTPFAINANVFTNVPATAVLYVPVGTKGLYEATGGWKNFPGSIVEVNQIWEKDMEITEHIGWGNLSFENSSLSPWTFESSKGEITTGGAFECYDGADEDLYQNVWLPAGTYRLECQGYYRCGSAWEDDPNSYYYKDNWEDNAMLYASTTYDTGNSFTFKTPLMPRLFQKQTEQLYWGPQESDSNWPGWDMSDAYYDYGSNGSGWGPVSVPGSLVWFAAGKYQPYDDGTVKYNTVTFFLEEAGFVRIGVKKSKARSLDAFVVTNFKMYKVSDENIIEFADAEVKRICMENWDTSGDGELSAAEAAAVTSLGNVFQNNDSIKSFDELQFFTGLTSIGNYAFWGCIGLTSVTIPNSVTSIGYDAFAHCIGLTSVTIPNSVTSIGDWAFQNCIGLTSVTIGSGVTSIGAGAFYDGRGLESINVHPSNPKYEDCSGSNIIVEKSTRTLILGCKGTEEIPNSVTSIGDYAFACCHGLTSVTIPNSVTSIGDYAFYGCSGLTSVTIPNSVTSIGSSAFFGCSCLTSVTIPNSVTSIGEGAFQYCNGLTSVTIPNSVTSIGEYAFIGCSGLTSVTIGSGVTSIGEGAFNYCSSLTTMVMENATPIIMNKNSFDDSQIQNRQITLYVPYGSKSAYEATDDYSEIFAEIVEMEPEEEDTDISLIDNVVYIEPVEAKAGEQLVLSVKMKNTEAIQTVQFDLYLPDGVEVARDEDGFELISLSTERTTSRKMDSFSTNQLPNGAYRVLINSSRRYTFDGEDGEITQVTVNVSPDMAEGDYPILIKDIILVNTESQGFETECVKSTLTIYTYTPGDVNNDGKINAIDLNAIVNYIMERRTFPFYFNEKAADLNGDNKINAIDVNMVTNMIMQGNSLNAGRFTMNDAVFINEIEIK